MQSDKNYITTDNIGDGFGAQLFSRISAIIYSKFHKLNYLHNPIPGILLVDKPEISRTNDLENANELLNIIMSNLNIANINEVGNQNNIEVYHRTYFYNQILTDVDNYINDNILKEFQKSYKKDYPDFYKKNNVNIAIHIRRGNDIQSDDSFRYINANVYDKIIEILLEKFQNAIIHVFSWNDPQIKIKSERLVNHITLDGGEEFVSDFNALVHADILLVGSSTFSLSAGFFNKNKVLCSKKLFKLYSNSPFPSIWERNFENIIGQI